MSAPKTKRNNKILERRKQGLSVLQIARRFRRERQTIYNIIRRETVKSECK